MQCKFGEPKAAYEDVSAVEIREKKEVVSTKQVSWVQLFLHILEKMKKLYLLGTCTENWETYRIRSLKIQDCVRKKKRTWVAIN